MFWARFKIYSKKSLSKFMTLPYFVVQINQLLNALVPFKNVFK